MNQEPSSKSSTWLINQSSASWLLRETISGRSSETSDDASRLSPCRTSIASLSFFSLWSAFSCHHVNRSTESVISASPNRFKPSESCFELRFSAEAGACDQARRRRASVKASSAVSARMAFQSDTVPLRSISRSWRASVRSLFAVVHALRVALPNDVPE